MKQETTAQRWRRWGAIVCLFFPLLLHASEQHGSVLSNHFPVPGATIIATQGDRKFVTVSDEHGNYSFADLPDGTWKIVVTMSLFSPVEQEIMVHAGTAAANFELKMLSVDQMLASAKLSTAHSAEPSAPPASGATTSPQKTAAREGLVVNGSVNNAATSQFSLNQAFGNTRNHSHGIYNGGLGLIFGDSALDARSYSLSGVEAAKPGFSQVTLTASLGGPLVIPHLLVRRGPNFAVNYELTRDNDAVDQTGLVPTLLQRTTTVSAIDPVAQALLDYYPLPNVTGDSSYNYQLPVVNPTHKDALQSRLEKNFGRDSITGKFAFQDSRADTTSIFGFRDTTDTLGLNTDVTYSHRFAGNMFANVEYQFSRLRSQITPFFADRVNVSGEAGMTGNNQEPTNWGPPTLNFSSGIVSLTDAESSLNRNETNSIGGHLEWFFHRHDITAGGDFRRQEFNYYSQENPRGIFTFNGDATGSDLSDFFSGIPDTASLVSGNPDKYLRESVSDLYATDDWHLAPDLTMNIGLRWEYSAPVTELKDRLANLDVSSGFADVATVVATDPVGAITGEHYPNSLLRPDRSMIEPRLSLSWRPLAASSLIIRGGYGIYADTSLYQSIALQLAQQAPFATSISASNSICAQSLKTGPNACSESTADLFGIDPNFRVGFAQVWQVSAQRDLPAALQMVVTYQGIRGSNGVQQFLPNSYPVGATNPCASCQSGFNYETSGGSSSREAGTVQLRRRLRSGLTASLQYTYSKSTDDDSALGGQGPLAAGATSAAATTMSTAQNWRDLGAERSLSSFDQRHLLNATLQYTTGMGIGGGTLMSGWLGRMYKEWTIVNTIAAGTGMPETPVYDAIVPGTGFSGSIRPDRTSASLYDGPAGHFVNPAAFTAPQSGQWGTAGRDSVTGPGTFTFDSSLQRTFRPTQRYYLDIRADATNVLNHPVYTSYNLTVDPTTTNTIFGVPASVNAMRSLKITARLRF
ncbi:carboxypeptidase regulatory-like domain-containing protein [Silvibacterium sp.]|uniref:carboxypeptidase regulatory-like domain-containing protein n=1 Tax=Silvibacterium sp. TaxID=1964179 RepID=UPI0039E39FE0